jgi:succinoglycan biosynthesis transport protein ExoP
MAYLETTVLDPALPPLPPAPGRGHVGDTRVEPRSAFTELLATLGRRWKLIAAFTGGTLLVAAIGTLLATPRYTATALVHVKLQAPHATNIQQVVAPPTDLEAIEYFQDQVKILQSRSLAARVIRELGLDKDERFIGPANGPSFVETLLYRIAGSLGRLRDTLRPGASPTAADASHHDRGEAVQDVPSALIGRYERWLEVKPVTNSRLVEVDFTSPSPSVAQRVANAHARFYIRQMLESKFKLTGEARQFLEAEIDRVQKELAQAEQALNDFRRKNRVVSVDEKENVDVDRLSDLGRRLTDAEAVRIAAEADRKMVAERDPDSLPTVLQSPVIQTLKSEVTRLDIQQAQVGETFLPGTPQMKEVNAQLSSARARLKREVDRAVAAIESTYLGAKAREDELRAQFDAQQEAVLGLKEISGEYVKLEQKVTTTRQLYGTLIQRLQETDVVKGDTLSNASVLDAAEKPTQPSEPMVLFDLAFALVLGLSLGIGVALVLEHVDASFRTPDEVRRQLQLPTLGVVPDFARVPSRPAANALPAPRMLFGRLGRRAPVELPPDRSLSAEAYRSIRTSVLFFNPQAPPRSLLVTSSQPQEGKTATTVNLALSLAQVHRSIVVVDADMRQARCHRALGLPPAAGLSEVLRGLARLPHVVQRLTVQGGRVVRADAGDVGGPELHLLQAGRAPADPAALLASPRMDEVLQALLETYDLVLIDSPPVFPITDSAILASKVDGVVFVVRGHRTDRQVTREALERLRFMNANVMGVVLNGVDPGSSHYHRYAYYFAA